MTKYAYADLKKVVLMHDTGSDNYAPYAATGTAITDPHRKIEDLARVVVMRATGDGTYEPYEIS